MNLTKKDKKKLQAYEEFTGSKFTIFHSSKELSKFFHTPTRGEIVRKRSANKKN